MDLAYRILGLVAKLCERMSRHSVNGIPSHWFVILFLAVFLGLAINEVREGAKNTGSAIPISLADALTKDQLLGRYVTIAAEPVPEEMLVYSKKDSDKIEDAESLWVPLIDRQNLYAIYAHIPTKDVPPGSVSKTAVTGMLRTMDQKLKIELQRSPRRVSGLSVDASRMLVVGQKPTRLWVSVTCSLVLAGALLLVLLVICIRYTIFRPVPERRIGINLAEASRADETPPPLHLSGFLSLTSNDRQRFHNVPAFLAELNTGEKAFLANLDASVTFMGSKTKDRAGIWTSIVKPRTLRPAEYGNFYFGLKCLPALRVSYTDSLTNRSVRTILILPTQSDCDSLRKSLYAPATSIQPAQAPTA